MNNERLSLLLKYMNGLNSLNDCGHKCNSEIDECIGWIREEFTKEPKEPFSDDKTDISISVMRADNRELIASIVLNGDDAIVHKDYVVEVDRND